MRFRGAEVDYETSRSAAREAGGSGSFVMRFRRAEVDYETSFSEEVEFFALVV
jgi:hypothetical protein